MPTSKYLSRVKLKQIKYDVPQVTPGNKDEYKFKLKIHDCIALGKNDIDTRISFNKWNCTLITAGHGGNLERQTGVNISLV